MSPERLEDLLTLVGPFIAKKPCRTMTSGIPFDRLSRLRALPYDCFKIYTIVPIMNSILSKRSRSSQSSGSFAIVWVAFPYDRSDRLNIF